MLKYRIRFNKARGQPGRGTQEHVWRVLQGNTEWLARHVIIEVPSRSEQEGQDWNASTDVTMTPEMTDYRQALRDVPAQAGFPSTVAWPTSPQ